ncbi:hypothetical protein COCSADRAFT_307695 [Bipolaris sorokiniana ND90Pr]|uniref:Uncharacterized protein n=1 Tax=Cochliobolus sativus (strain ND90Pr / ATCC 201652) TaxID=665912 RepID=M2STK2_COCSN|nr:uncharacterized protein COCSADRAFT_307695 [Bipolaris sorokiniana ND90Pr]EMD65605.1 hypothetical protein COCSADRAFT_307695 [Bipolaris sorokiniana ND90Pr]
MCKFLLKLGCIRSLLLSLGPQPQTPGHSFQSTQHSASFISQPPRQVSGRSPEHSLQQSPSPLLFTCSYSIHL